jgi:hypothetical protein
MKTVGPYHDIDFYVNIKQIVKTILAQDTTGETSTSRQRLTNLGMDNVVSLACSMGLARSPGSSWSAKAYLKIEGVKKGICKMLEAESAFLKAPLFIPASTYSATFFNLNIKRAYNELYNILYTFSPQYAAMAHIPLLPPSPQGEPGLTLKTDIIDHLGSQIILTQGVDKPLSKNSKPEHLVALAVNNRTALEKSLSLIHGKMFAVNNPDTRRELLGHTIYLIDLSGMLPFFQPGMTPMLARRGGQFPAGAPVPQTPVLAFTITETHLIFGVEPAVDRAIRTLTSGRSASVSSAKWFNIAKSAIPSVVGLACLQNNAIASELLWSAKGGLKEADKNKDGNSSISAGISIGPNPGLMFSQSGLFDVGLLPPFDAVRKYFGVSAFYGVSRPDGFLFEFRDINPKDTD